MRSFVIADELIPPPDPVPHLARRGSHSLWWSQGDEAQWWLPVEAKPLVKYPRFLVHVRVAFDRDGRLEGGSWALHLTNGDDRFFYTVPPANLADAWAEQALYWAYLARVVRRLPKEQRPAATKLAQDWAGTAGEFEEVAPLIVGHPAAI